MFHARAQEGANTQYATFKTVRSQLDGSGSDAVLTADIGESPVGRWLAYALDYSDAVSEATGITAQIGIDSGTIIIRGGLTRVDTAFDTGITIDIGDLDDTDGWADRHAVDTAGIILYDTSAAYNVYDDASKGVKGMQYYENGGTLVVTFSAMPTQGEAVIFLETISYNEPLGAEWR